MTGDDTPEHVPDDAEPFIDPDGHTPGYALFGNLWLTDGAIYECQACGEHTLRDDECPACGCENLNVLTRGP